MLTCMPHWWPNWTGHYVLACLQNFHWKTAPSRAPTSAVCWCSANGRCNKTVVKNVGYNISKTKLQYVPNTSLVCCSWLTNSQLCKNPVWNNIITQNLNHSSTRKQTNLAPLATAAPLSGDDQMFIMLLRAWFRQAKHVCGSVQFGSVRFTLVQYGVCWHNKFWE